MVRIPPALAQLKRDETGFAALQYGLVAALVAVLLFGAIDALGASLGTMFGGVASQLGMQASFCKRPYVPGYDGSCQLVPEAL